MTRRETRRLTLMAVCALLAAANACAPSIDPGIRVSVPLMTKDYQRYAETGGTVTVDVTVFAGSLPDTNMAVGQTDTVALFMNRGEGGKKERRYKWKPRGQAIYTLVLKGDAIGKTRWEMIETDRLTLARVRHMYGHLATCDPRHPPPTARDVYFKSCSLPVEYNPGETVAGAPQAKVGFAFYPDADTFESLQSETPIWISCNSGCCSLGRAAY